MPAYRSGLMCCHRLEKEILDRYLDVVLKGNKDGLKVKAMLIIVIFQLFSIIDFCLIGVSYFCWVIVLLNFEPLQLPIDKTSVEKLTG